MRSRAAAQPGLRPPEIVGWSLVAAAFVNVSTGFCIPSFIVRIFADADVILANSTRPSGQAVVVEGGYRVSGRWSLVSGCQLSAWLILMCIVHKDGQPSLTPSGAPESRFMLCPTADCEIIDTWTVGGLRGTGSHDVVARDLFVPSRYASFFTDPVVLPGRRYQFPFTSRITPGVGAMAPGVARSAIEALVDLAVEKRHERTTQSLREDRGAQTRLSQADALVRSARLFLFDTVSRLWVTCWRDESPRPRGGLRCAWRTGMQSPAPRRRWISPISRAARPRSTQAAPWSGPSATCMHG